MSKLSNQIIDAIREVAGKNYLPLHEPKFDELEKENLNNCIDTTYVSTVGEYVNHFEENIAEQESRRQFLGFLAGGLSVPLNLVEKEFKKENQIKKIKYINLEEYYSKFKPSNTKVEKFFKDNKEIFIKEFKSIKYAEISSNISGNNEYDENFFRQLDIIENKVLDGQSFESASEENDLKIISISKVDKDKKDLNKNLVKNLPDNLFDKIYSIKKEKSPEVLKVDNKYYLAVVSSISIENRSLDDPFVAELINNQLKFRNKIENNNAILKELENQKPNIDQLKKIASKRNLNLLEHKITDFKKDKIFSQGIIKQIFLIKDGEMKLITDSNLSKSFIIFSEQTNYKKLIKDSNDFERYEAKARLSLVNNIYKTFDSNLNKKYKVELNQKTIDRVKNSF